MLDGLTSGLAIIGYFGLAFSAFLLWAERWTKKKYPKEWKPLFWWNFSDKSNSWYSNSRYLPFGWVMILVFLGSLYCIYLGLTGQQ